jgi:hypothetical protein
VTINLGTINAVATHFGEFNAADLPLPPQTLCIKGGGRFQSGALNLFTTDRGKVTCTACLEWMHA